MAIITIKRIELGHCPFCEGEDLEYPNGMQYDIMGNPIYEVHCNECGKDFKEHYRLKFIGMTDMDDNELEEDDDYEEDIA